MENYPIQVHISLKRLLIAATYAIVLSLFLIQLGTSFAIYKTQYGLISFAIAISTLFLALDIDFSNERWRLVYNLILIVFLSIVITIILDLLNGMYGRPEETSVLLNVERFLISSAFVFLIYLLFLAITGRMRLAVILGTVFFYLFGFISYAVLVLRGSRLVFSDITAFGTAVNVLGGYNFLPMNEGFFLGVFTTICTFPFLLAVKPQRFKLKGLERLGFYFVFLFGFFAIYMSSFEDLNYSWLESENSYLYEFATNAKLLNVPEPSGYDSAQVEELLLDSEVETRLLKSGYDAKKEITNTFPEYVQRTGSTNPNIIVVMNESFSDLEVFGDIPVKEEIFPVTSKLTNCIQGDVFTEVFGGGTSDTEYTYLTGNSTYLFPINARPYQLYVDDETPNLSTRLKEIGYETVAIHPGQSQAWNRENVYQDFDFDAFYSANDFIGAPYKRIKELKTDASTYEKIIELYENKGDKPLFIFDVTIQNHGGYSLNPDMLETVHVDGEASSELVEYLSLVRASDIDFNQLIEFFSVQNEPTLICMFGDHQPNLLSSFPGQLSGKEKDDLTLKEDQRLQATPYIIWANYPLPREPVGSMSINFLPVLTLECAGIETTAYEQYLAKLFKSFIVLDKKGIVDSDGHYFTYDDENLSSKQRALIEEYKKVLYYSALEKNKNTDLFSVKKE